MPGDPFSHAARFTTEYGLAYLFGGTRAADLPNLHHELTGRDQIDEWSDETQLVWECRGELPRRGVAWYGEWLRSRGTFVAAQLLPAALAWLEHPLDEQAALSQARALGAEVGLIYEVLTAEGPTATMELRAAAGFEEDTKAFQRALKRLQRSLMITHFGSKRERSSWASGVFEPTIRAFPLSELPEPLDGLRQLLDAYRRASPLPQPETAAPLFGASKGQVGALWE